MPSRNLGERKSLELDDGVGLDQQGYVLVTGDTADVKKSTTPTDRVVGVNYVSTRGHGRFGQQEVRTGIEAAVIHDGYPNVLVAEGYNYGSGDAVYLSDPSNADGYEGVATADADPAGDGSVDPTKVGTVVPGAGKDLTGADGPELLQVDITSNLGEQ